MKKVALLFAIFAIGLQSLWAQTKEITGKVTSADDGQTLPGVTVLVKGTTMGTVTDIDGNYRLKVPESAKALVFSFVGMTTKEMPLTSSTINVKLEKNNIGVDEVVVTALGIKRSQKTLGYAATTVKDDEIVKARNTDVTSSLQGKIAGVQISSTSTDPGSSSSIVIRGFSSINGENQPLYVVDGVPMQNDNMSSSGHTISLAGISNIASDDIASMTILKGAAATALYGNRAANGVIVITTKQGSKGKDKNFTINFNGGVQYRQVAFLPKFQNEFGQGWNGQQTFIENGSWGPRLDGSTQVYGPIWNGEQLIHTYSAKKDNVKDFFDLGVSKNAQISISGASADNKMTYYLSFSHADDDGIMPTDADSYIRNTIAYRSTYQAADWLKVSSSLNFSKTSTDVVGSFQGTSVIDGLYEMPRDVSIVDMQDLSSAFNTPEAYFTPYGITNPYWSLENNYNHTNAKQVFGKLQADITPIKDVKVTYRFGYDYSDYDLKIGTPEIDLDDALIDEDYGYAPSNMNQDGSVYVRYGRSYELNHDFMINYNNTKIGNFSVNAIAGLNVNEIYKTYMYGETEGLTIDTGFWDLSNGSTISDLTEIQKKQRLIGAFGDVTLGFKDALFLELTARNDWSSTLPLDNNSFFYPGATLSWIFTESLPKNNWLSFGKLRVAYGKTGNDADVYQTSTSYVQAYANGYYGNDIASFPTNSTNSFQADYTKGSSDLQPEMTTEYETGLNLKFFSGRIGLDASYYHRITNDQIFTLPVDPATGYQKKVTNFGKVRNQGIELLLSTTPIQTRKIRWNLNINFALNRNKVLTLPAAIDGGKSAIYKFSAGDDAVNMYAEKGKPMGEYYTYLPTYVEDEDSPYYGDMIVDDSGEPVLSSDLEDTGMNMNNKWTGGITTSFSAYGFTLSATLDVRYGGYMFSRTKNLMQFTGNGIITTYNDRKPFVIPNSVVASEDGDGNVTYSENTTQLKVTDGSLQEYYNDYGWGNGGKAYMVDRTFTKLRNITLSYDVPKKWLTNIGIPLSTVSLSAFANNVFTWTAKDNYYIDPESTTLGNDLAGQFGELYSNPSSRIFGFNLRLTY